MNQGVKARLATGTTYLPRDNLTRLLTRYSSFWYIASIEALLLFTTTSRRIILPSFAFPAGRKLHQACDAAPCFRLVISVILLSWVWIPAGAARRLPSHSTLSRDPIFSGYLPWSA